MRTGIGRWVGSRGVFTYSVNMELCGITADFAGGFVQVNGVVYEINPTPGNWGGVQVTVDGVPQGPSRTVWQATGQGNIQLGISHTVRVPPGRHRVALVLSSSAGAGFAGNGAYIDVAE